MTQLNFTIDIEDLKEKIENSSLDAVLKSMVTIVLNEYMEKERDEYLQALPSERTANRRGYRNGYYERELVIPLGSLTLKVPRTRDGEFTTSVFQQFQRCDQALVLSMMEMVVNGISTRKVNNVVEQLCGKNVSKSFVSSLMKELDPVVHEWRTRPLNTMYFPFVYVDATYIKVREHDRVVSKAIHIAMGVNETGHREIIGLQITHGESKESWAAFFDHLKSRGLQSPKLVTSDAHKGLIPAIQESFLGTAWQRCTVHFLRNMVNAMPKKNTEEARTELKAIFQATDLSLARELKKRFMEKYQDTKGFSSMLKQLDEGFEDAMQHHSQPMSYHKHLRTTNVLERLNSEIKRREKVIRIFPHDQSAIRIVGAVLKDLEESWGKKKFIKAM